MHGLKFFALSSLAVIVFDVVASATSLLLGFPYAYAALGSAVLYVAFAFFAARKFGFGIAVLLGVTMGIVDATIGWALAWAIGPGRLASGALTLAIWLFTAAIVVALGAVYGLIGGGLGSLTRQRRAV